MLGTDPGLGSPPLLATTLLVTGSGGRMALGGEGLDWRDGEEVRKDGSRWWVRNGGGAAADGVAAITSAGVALGGAAAAVVLVGGGGERATMRS